MFYNPSNEESVFFYNIKKELERKYNIRLTSRDLIIKQLISTLTHGDYLKYSIPKISLVIIRSDIKNFFPSINKHILYKKMSRSNLLSSESLDILKPMFFSNSVQGIPLGLPFSSALAEIYLENFDYNINSMFLPTFYFRYVDDIIIVKYNTIQGVNLEVEKEQLLNVFKNHFLEINTSKTEVIEYTDVKELSFSYLGYKFESVCNRLDISISEEKLKKVSDRVKGYFYSFKKSSRSKTQFWILYYKILNSVYGITSIDKNMKIMHFGLGYTYRFVNNEKQIRFLLLMIKGQIFSCKLSSYQTSTLLQVIAFDACPLEVLNKRYDYTRLTSNQLAKIKKRLNIKAESNDISRIFYTLYK